jgi:hypothetical protein
LSAVCPGSFEIDTTCTDPANHLVFARTLGTPSAVIPTFTKGVINVICNPCPTNTTNLATVSAVVGSPASKALSATDDEADTFAWISGPGGATTVTTTNPGPPSAAGLWSYTPKCDDYPGFDVVFEVYNSNGQGNCGNATFHVDVAPTPLVLSNCGNVTAHWGDAVEKIIGVTGGCPPYQFVENGMGDVDVDGKWTYTTSCQDLGTHAISITVTDAAQQSADCSFDLIVTNTLPTCNPPVPDPVVTTSATFILGADADGDGVTVTLISGTGWPGELVTGNSYFTGTRDDTAEPVILYTVSDGCQSSVECSFKARFESEFTICITDLEDDLCTPKGGTYAHTLGGKNKTIGILAGGGSSAGVGGFDFLVCYDNSILRFIKAERGCDLDPTWEYFTYRTGMFGGNCGSACPNGYVKLIGIANMNNGVTPAETAFALKGVILTLTFYVGGSTTDIGLCPHVGFCSIECGDNSISSRNGNLLFLPYFPFVPGTDPPNYHVTFGPDYVCGGIVKGMEPYEFIIFCPGAICIDRPPDDRGDINLNGVANEIADAVLFSNFFIYGIDATFEAGGPPFYLRELQVLSTDVNADGLTLTVADLVYLIRIITGDAQPFPPDAGGPKLSPYANSVDVLTNVTDGALTVRTNSTVDLGAALFVYRYSGLTIGEPALTAGTNLKIKSLANNGELRILVYGMTSGAKVPAGLNNLITVPVSGDGTIELAESQVSDYNGALLTVNAVAKATPSTYALLQNYPNPFNAGTVIQFSLKNQTNWNLSIYNIAGQIVRTFSGNGEGTVSVTWDGTSANGSPIASGMYFYRLNTREFTATKKMVLMK